ncbi:hypothetical protein QR685DRAFT_536335 [Neurospora intermedia]|uniref:Uncharacterized protein n=1 Tax=Neurospora intermedia TaxID=5142 RepID=A0ABR3D3X5_NEUIN
MDLTGSGFFVGIESHPLPKSLINERHLSTPYGWQLANGVRIASNSTEKVNVACCFARVQKPFQSVETPNSRACGRYRLEERRLEPVRSPSSTTRKRKSIIEFP